MSLRVFEKQSPVTRGDCFATCARNDMQDASLRKLQSASGAPKGRDKELGLLRALTLSQNEASGMLSILDKVLKSEL
jgi:hypothetical protein